MTAAEIEKTGIFLNLPSSFYLSSVELMRSASGAQVPSAGEEEEPTESARYEALKPLNHSIIDKSFRALGLRAPPPQYQRFFFGDQAGIGEVLEEAHRLLASNAVSTCLVGGVDSLVEPRWMRACDELQILKTPLRPVGLIPGEAAALLLLERHRGPANGRKRLGAIVASARGRANSHRFSDPRPDGTVLADIVRRCRPADRPQDVGVICDLNGDEPRAVEFGTLLTLIQPDLRVVETIVPAIAFGDTRAAYAFVGACVALSAFARGYAQSRQFLLCSANDDGGRATVLIETMN